MPRSRVVLTALATVVLAVPAAADAATLSTGRPCYTASQQMTIIGTDWLPGSRWAVQAEQVFDSGVVEPTGSFTSSKPQAPLLPEDTGLITTQTFTLRGTQDGIEVATTTFRVVNFLARPRRPTGNALSMTRWVFSGFRPGKRIYVHVTRGAEIYTVQAGWGDPDCGILRTRLRRLPGVPAAKIRRGRYKVFVDNRRAFREGGLQYRASITI